MVRPLPLTANVLRMAPAPPLDAIACVCPAVDACAVPTRVSYWCQGRSFLVLHGLPAATGTVRSGRQDAFTLAHPTMRAAWCRTRTTVWRCWATSCWRPQPCSTCLSARRVAGRTHAAMCGPRRAGWRGAAASSDPPDHCPAHLGAVAARHGPVPAHHRRVRAAEPARKCRTSLLLRRRVPARVAGEGRAAAPRVRPPPHRFAPQPNSFAGTLWNIDPRHNVSATAFARAFGDPARALAFAPRMCTSSVHHSQLHGRGHRRAVPGHAARGLRHDHVFVRPLIRLAQRPRPHAAVAAAQPTRSDHRSCWASAARE
jgi:hypothetical protein